MHKGFADLSLTAWVRCHIQVKYSKKGILCQAETQGFTEINFLKKSISAEKKTVFPVYL